MPLGLAEGEARLERMICRRPTRTDHSADIKLLASAPSPSLLTGRTIYKRPGGVVTNAFASIGFARCSGALSAVSVILIMPAEPGARQYEVLDMLNSALESSPARLSARMCVYLTLYPQQFTCCKRLITSCDAPSSHCPIPRGCPKGSGLRPLRPSTPSPRAWRPGQRGKTTKATSSR